MFRLILMLIAAIVAGNLLTHTVIMTIGWLRDKISEKLRQKKAKKVFLSDIDKLIEEALKNKNNRININELDKLTNEGYTHVMVTVDDKCQILGDVDTIKNESDTLDVEVERLLTRKGYVTIEV